VTSVKVTTPWARSIRPRNRKINVNVSFLIIMGF
jgi:hypothetical protein